MPTLWIGPRSVWMRLLRSALPRLTVDVMTEQNPPRPGPTDSDPIPDIDTFTDPFSTTEELRQRWRAMMGPLGFAEYRLWVGFASDGALIKQITYLVLEGPPDPCVCDVFVSRLASAMDEAPDLKVAFMLSRPGSGGISPHDIGWARLLADSARFIGLPLLPIHRANDEDLVTLPVHVDAADAA